jgi:hypothetical protein
MCEFVKFLTLSNPLEQGSDHFCCRLCLPGSINKDPTVWLDGARPPSKYIFKNNLSLTNSKICATQTTIKNCRNRHKFKNNNLNIHIKTSKHLVQESIQDKVLQALIILFKKIHLPGFELTIFCIVKIPTIG